MADLLKVLLGIVTFGVLFYLQNLCARRADEAKQRYEDAMRKAGIEPGHCWICNRFNLGDEDDMMCPDCIKLYDMEAKKRAGS